MCILGIKEQVDVNIDAECISVEKGETPTLRARRNPKDLTILASIKSNQLKLN